jgi:hypothetical protein
VKNHNIANNSTAAEDREELNTILEPLEFLKENLCLLFKIQKQSNFI